MRLRALLGPPVLLGLLWAAVIWWPSQMAITSANEQVDQADSQQLLLVTNIDRLSQSSNQQTDLDADLEAIARAIPNDPGIDIFLGTLADTATQNGVRVNLVSPTDILDSVTADPNRPVPAGLSATAISLEAEGSYGAVMTFTANLAELSRLVVVDHISMVAIEGDTQVIVIDLSLRIFSNDQSSQEFGE